MLVSGLFWLFMTREGGSLALDEERVRNSAPCFPSSRLDLMQLDPTTCILCSIYHQKSSFTTFLTVPETHHRHLPSL